MQRLLIDLSDIIQWLMCLFACLLCVRSYLQGRTDVVALLDEFAYRFYEELDYVKEVCLSSALAL